jgi:EAL domain-containing protein (putative c-di-GMP-specific phosphodiesterase class I)
MVPSRDLIPMAEETGLIVPLGQWVLEEACRQLVRWQGCFGVEPPLTLNVNLSSVQFRRPELVAEVTRALSESGLAPACLRLEVTEATIMRDADHAVRTLWSLKRLGVQLAIDDFGAGYSALPYLKQLPIGLLKIDGAFIRGMGHDQEDTATVRAVMSLAKSLGWGVTAEGIETAAQAQLLVEWGCDFGQGYHFGRPMDGTRAGEYLTAALAGSGLAGRVRLAVVQ